ncbi:Rho guanine nucleotide exchange factor 25 [Sarotherodon galilaeus]
MMGGNCISGSVVDLTVRSGDNITLYCNCKTSSKEFLVWYRNCTHENQPSLVLKLEEDSWKPTTDQATLVNSLSRFHFVKNQSSGSYDLLIINISYSDEGLYYLINLKYIYRYGSIFTRILINSSNQHYSTSTSTDCLTTPDCSMCWKLLFILCPASSVFSSFLVSLLVHHICQKKVDQPKPEMSGKARRNQDEDVFYATVKTSQATQRPKKKITYSSEFCTYSAINTSKL